ncbi:unnamed protein product [Vicia faba]|uniref:Uncharacterized protein n=1 Tax=Vicia faba TaxID=3906 RepID=A0AAV1ALP9_VICFA|nr:unnamed protein product [Vicia faba]
MAAVPPSENRQMPITIVPTHVGHMIPPIPIWTLSFSNPLHISDLLHSTTPLQHTPSSSHSPSPTLKTTTRPKTISRFRSTTLTTTIAPIRHHQACQPPNTSSEVSVTDDHTRFHLYFSQLLFHVFVVMSKSGKIWHKFVCLMKRKRDTGERGRGIESEK